MPGSVLDIGITAGKETDINKHDGKGLSSNPSPTNYAT
jgi:hypothetical protein